MRIPLGRRPRGIGRRRPVPFQTNQLEVYAMKWETPQAIDLRFGMEITMYIANR